MNDDKIEEIIKILEEYGIATKIQGDHMTVLAAAEDINALFTDNTPDDTNKHPFPKKD